MRHQLILCAIIFALARCIQSVVSRIFFVYNHFCISGWYALILQNDKLVLRNATSGKKVNVLVEQGSVSMRPKNYNHFYEGGVC